MDSPPTYAAKPCAGSGKSPLPLWQLGWGIFALLTLAGSGAARADEPGTSLLDIPLTQLGELRVNTVYAASKFREKIADSPASVTIVTREEIRKFGYRTLADIARSVRGFDVTYDRSYSYTGVRGLNGLGDYGSHVLLLVDGHRMNDPIYDVVAVGTEGLLDVDLIERVEFIRGPSSQMYGSNTFSGAIIVGNAPLEGSLAKCIRSRSANGRQIVIRQLNANDKAGMRQCHLIYLSPGEIAANAVEAVKGLPVLMVGDSDRAVQDGCCIGLVMRNQRIKLEINQETARQAQLSISSDLLGIATLVRRPSL